MQKFLPFLLLAMPFFCFSQVVPRTLLSGKVIADSIDVENVRVINTTTNIEAVTDRFGEFTIFVKPKDTLIFAGSAFESKVMVIEPDDLLYERLKIRLGMAVNMLDEVIVYPTKLTGDLESDSRRIKTKDIPMPNMKLVPKYYAVDAQTKLNNNESMPVLESALQGVNFVAIGKFVGKIFGKTETKTKPIRIKEDNVLFADAVKLKFSYHFFTKTLGINHDEIGLFLNFCDTEEVREESLLSADKEFELTDYLIRKSVDFRKR